MLDHRLTHVVLQLAFLAVVVNGVVTAAAAAAAAAVDATRLLCLDEHVTHSLQRHTTRYYSAFCGGRTPLRSTTIYARVC